MKFKYLVAVILSQALAACSSLQTVSKIGFETPTNNIQQDHQRIEEVLSSMRFESINVDGGVHTYSRFDDIVTVYLNEQDNVINVYSLDKNEEASIIKKLQKALPTIAQMEASTCRLVADDVINFKAISSTNNFRTKNRLYIDVRRFLEDNHYIAGQGLQGKDFTGGRVSEGCNFMNSVHLNNTTNNVSARFRIFANTDLTDTNYPQQRDEFVSFIDSRYFIFHSSVTSQL